MSAQFQFAFLKTSAAEGGYANNPNDKGGETYRGIARRFWAGWKGWAIIDAAKAKGQNPNKINSPILDGLVTDFYTDHFWNPLSLSKMAQGVAEELYDTAVNMGINRAAVFLQDALNILGERVSIDGRIGPKTVEAANRVNPLVLVRVLNILQGARYLDIVRADPTQREFLNGWLLRAEPPAKSTKGPTPPPEQ